MLGYDESFVWWQIYVNQRFHGNDKQIGPKTVYLKFLSI